MPHLLQSLRADSLLFEGRAHTSNPAGPRIVLGPAGKCPSTPTHTTLVVDDSASVTGGNDPIGRRFEEARYAIEAVARRCRCGKCSAAVIHFDCPTSHDVPPTPLRGSGVGTLARGLQLPTNVPGTSAMGNALSRAYAIQRSLPTHEHVIVVLSDFLLLDSQVPKILSDFASFPGSVHAAVLGAGPPEQFEDDARVRVALINHDSERGAVAKAVFAALTDLRVATRRIA